MNLKKMTTFLIIVLMLLELAGCGKVKLHTNPFDADIEYSSIDSGIVAENSLYSILWDNEDGEVSFKDKTTGNIWGAAPFGMDEDVITNPNFKAPIVVKYIESETYIDKTLNSFTNSVRKSSYSVEQIKNGIKVIYCFDDAEIAVPVCFEISKDGFHMYIETAEIKENKNHIYSISFMPFLAGVNNSLTSKQGYIFSPSGSGTLIYPKMLGDGIGITETDDVYGRDYNNDYVDSVNPIGIKLPVFGSKSGENGVCGIIESGAENALLSYNIGSVNLGYSTVYPVFNIRGSLYCDLNVMNKTEQAVVYSDEHIRNKISIRYTPLTGEKANYMGIAECYRNYLIENKGLSEANTETLINLKIIGGVVTKKYTFGVPYNSLHVTTSFSDAARIISDINQETGEVINADLIGFSKTGLSPGQIAGGYTYNRKFGNPDELDCVKKKANLFFDYDIIFAESSKLSVFSSKTSLNLSKKRQIVNSVDFVTGGLNVNDTATSLVSRDALGEVLKNSIKKTNQMGFSGISLSSLSNIAYSDYKENRYVAKSFMSNQVSAMMNGVSKSGLKLAVSAANDYAFYNANHIYDAPTVSSKNQLFDCDIPFYEIVLKGYVPMSVNSVNISDDMKNTMLNAIESGIGLTYTVISKYDTLLINSNNNMFYYSVYKNLKNEIMNEADEYKNLFEDLKCQTITGHTVLNNSVRITEYSNGMRICVNYGNTDFQVEGKTVGAKNFAVLEGR